MAIARPRTPTNPRKESDRPTTPGRPKTPTGIPGPSPGATDSTSASTSPTGRPTTPGGRSKDSPTGIPRYFKSTQSYLIQLEEKGVIKPGTDPEAVVPTRPVTPGRRQSTGDAFADLLRTETVLTPAPAYVKPLEPSSSFTRPTASSNSKVNSASKQAEKEVKGRTSTPGRRNSLDGLEQSLASTSLSDSSTPNQNQHRTPGSGGGSAGSPNGKSKKHSPLGSPLESSSSLYGVPGFFKPTKSRLSHIKEREDSIGQVRPEDDPWWSARGGKVVECKSKIKDVVEKKLSHVSSKLHSSTASRASQIREKAVIERPGANLAYVPKLSSPDAINPHKHVPSRLHQPTQAVKNAEWKPKDDKNPLSDVLAKKPRQVPSRLLQAPAHTQTTKFYKEPDPRDVGSGWVKILPAGSSTRALTKPFAEVRPLAGENLTNRWLEQAYESQVMYDEEGNEIVPDEATDWAAVDMPGGHRSAERRRSSSRGRSASRDRRDSNTSAVALEDLFEDEAEPDPPAPPDTTRNRRSPGPVPPIPPN